MTVLPPEIETTDTDSPSLEKMHSQYVKQYVETETQKIHTFKKETIRVDVPAPTSPEGPRFVHHLEAKEVFETMTVTLECVVTGYPSPEITWYQDGARLLPSD